jgi:hypothetical protein
MNRLIKYFVFIRQLQRIYLQPNTSHSLPKRFLFLPKTTNKKRQMQAPSTPLKTKPGNTTNTSKQSQKIKGAFVRAIVPSLSVLLLS